MKKDINILWIDDTPVWQKEQQELFELTISDYGLLYGITYYSDADKVIDNLTNEANGFKVFDLIFVDYNISSQYMGNEVIKKLRDNKIDADTLFYSANPPSDLKKEATESGLAFDGVYYAERDEFQSKAIALYQKNIRNLLSLSNIRGFIMDKTSEIDFVINSYIAEKYNELDEAQKAKFIELMNSYFEDDMKAKASKSEVLKKELGKGVTNLNINKVLRSARDALTQDSRFKLFSRLQEELKTAEEPSCHSLATYKDEIISIRNNVAHKKIDISKCQKYILYYDTIKEFLENQCPDDCKGDVSSHSDDKKISLEQWLELVKKTNDYADWFNSILNELLPEKVLQKQS